MPDDRDQAQGGSLLDLLESTQEQLGKVQLEADINQAAEKEDRKRRGGCNEIR